MFVVPSIAAKIRESPTKPSKVINSKKNLSISVQNSVPSTGSTTNEHIRSNSGIGLHSSLSKFNGYEAVSTP